MTNDARAAADHLAELLDAERGTLVEFLLALAEFDRRRLWIELGYTSLFHFLNRHLGLSKGMAFYRKTAAELVQRFPEVIDPLRDGRLCITSVVHLAKVITPENRHEVIPRFLGQSRREAMVVAAELRPVEKPPFRTVLTAVAAPFAATPRVAAVAGCPGEERASLRVVQPAEPVRANSGDATDGIMGAQPTAAPPRAATEPLTASLRRLHVTVSDQFLRKLEAARDAMAHVLPHATEEAILEAGLDLLLARALKRQGAVVKKPRAPSAAVTPAPAPAISPAPASASSSRRIPAHVRREVWLRDQGRCQWPLASGGICGATRRLQLDHIRPIALGGASTAENLRIGCLFHNTLAARELLGDQVMDHYTSIAAPA